MKVLDVIVCKAGKSVSANLPEVDGFVISRPSFDKLKKDLRSGLEFHFEGLYEEERQPWMSEGYAFNFIFEDIPALIDSFNGTLNQSLLARIAGINESLMRQYVAGIKKPGKKVKERIKNGLKEFAVELNNIRFTEV